jgi:hypothetical protein
VSTKKIVLHTIDDFIIKAGIVEVDGEIVSSSTNPV